MSTENVTLEQQVVAELTKLGENDPELAERIRHVFPDWELGSADGSITLVLLQALEGLRAGELDQEHILRIAGPYFNGSSPPDDKAVFARLALFGRIVHHCPNPARREYACQLWADHLKQWYGTFIPWPRKIVDAAVAGRSIRDGNAELRWYSDTELAELPPTSDLVSGHLPEAALVLFYGPSGQGKTFMGLDLSQCVGTGLPWHGNAVQQGPVAFVAAEGVGGLSQRVDAWKRFHEWTESTDVRFLPQPVHVLEPTDMAAFIASLRTWDPSPQLIVLDTLAWCIAPGDENSTRDMSAFVAAVGELRAGLGATVLILHHTGHDKSRERGNTALAAASDTVVQVKDEDGQIVLTCTKQREAPPFHPLRFRLKEFAGSVVPERAIDDSTGDEPSERERTAIEALKAIYVEGESVSSTRWEEAAEMSRATFYRARKRLIDLGYVNMEKKGHVPVDKVAVPEQKDTRCAILKRFCLKIA